MTRGLVFLAFLALLAFAAVAGSCDPVHDQAQSALGPEAPGVRPGPTHRPGQPCLVCHDGALADPPAFSVAGTIFLDATGTTPVAGAQVTLQGRDGQSAVATTNAAGNFYVTPAEYAPAYPIHVTSVTVGNVAIAMRSHIGGEGSCAGCHFDPPGPGSAGHVYFNVPSGMTP